MQDRSAFQYIAIDQITESTTNPRRTFDDAKLYELAESITHNGLIQPITVRPRAQGFEIIAGARRFRAAMLADQFTVPARIVDVTDAQALEWQLVENSQRVDVHPYEEAQGFQRLLDLPGYDIATLTQKSGKSQSHVYSRLSLLQLIPTVAEAFTTERITASHAALIARLPHENQAAAFEQCWRKDWQDKEPHLLPSKYLASWIAANLHLPLADAPFSREDPALNPTAGACVTCPRRTGFNSSLFHDVQGDQCLDSPCYQTKVAAHVEREVAARPELVQIETGWRNPKEQKPGALQRGQFYDVPTPENMDAEPETACTSTRTAIVVFGKGVGTTLTVCTDRDCPIHDPRQEGRHTSPQSVPMPAHLEEPEEEETAEQRQGREEQRRAYTERQETEAAERRATFERQQQEREAEENRRAEQVQARRATLERLIETAPATPNAAQFRVLLRAVVHLDPYTFADDLAEEMSAEDAGNDDRSAEQTLLEALDSTTDEKLTGFAIRLALSGHVGIPRDGEPDFLTEAQAAFTQPEPQKGGKPRLVKTAAKKTTPKKTHAKKKAA